MRRKKFAGVVAAVVPLSMAMLGGNAAAFAEMTDPPAQMYTDWDSTQLPGFDTYGSVPPTMRDEWQMIGTTATGFSYASQWGRVVDSYDVHRLSTYKGYTCSARNDYVIDCAY